MEMDVGEKNAARGHRIFLIDTDVINRSALYVMLADANETHEFDCIADVAGTIARLAPDLIIVNAMLVAGYGKALIQGWRIAWPLVKILVVCEACDMECVTAAKAAGANDTLLRPFRLEAVRRAVQRWTERPVDMGIPPKRESHSLHVRH